MDMINDPVFKLLSTKTGFTSFDRSSAIFIFAQSIGTTTFPFATITSNPLASCIFSQNGNPFLSR